MGHTSTFSALKAICYLQLHKYLLQRNIVLIVGGMEIVEVTCGAPLGDSKEKSDTLDVSDDPQETNGSKVFGDRSHTGFPSDSFFGSIPATGLIKQGFCPGLTHGQKYGITYLASEDAPTTQKESTAVQSHSVVVVSDQTSIYSPSKSQSDDNDAQTRVRNDQRRVIHLPVEKSCGMWMNFLKLS
ncbi:hypothetical protein Q3G72_023082 [Acer saccharum]|nr:hypothetical protein Q3G72_023082 [Acer saccharum]